MRGRLGRDPAGSLRTVLLALLVLAAGGCAGERPSPVPGSGRATDAGLDALLAEARRVYDEGDRQAAYTLFSQLEEEAVRLSDPRVQAIAVTSMALAAWNLGEYDDARGLGERSIALKREHALDSLLSRSYNALGLVAYEESRFADALAMYDSTSRTAARVRDELSAGVAAGNRGLVLVELGLFEEARAGLRHQLEAGREAEGSSDPVRARRARIAVGNAYTNLGMIDVRLGNPSRALALLDSAVVIHEEIGAPREVMGALGHMGTAYTQIGDLGAALQLLDSALVVARDQGNRQEEASLYEAIAEVYLGSGDFRRTLDLFERARVINEDLGLTLESGVNLRTEAAILARLGDVGRAQEMARTAIELHAAIGAPVEEMRGRLLLAEILARTLDPAGADPELTRARMLSEEVDGRAWRVEVALAEARIADGLERPRDVIEAVRSIEEDLRLGGYDAEWQAHLLLSKALASLRRWDEALMEARAAWEAVERTRASLDPGPLRTTFGADKHEVYAHLIALLLRSGAVEDAYQVADAARGRRLPARPFPDQATGSSPAVRAAAPAVGTDDAGGAARIDRLLETAAYLEEIPSAERYATEEEALVFLYDRVAEVRRSDVGRVAAPPGTVGAGGTGPRTDVAAVRRALAPDQVVIEPFVPDTGAVVLFVVDRDGVRTVTSPLLAENVYSRVRVARALIAGRRAEGDEVLEALHSAMVQPLRDAGLLDGKREIVFVPHGSLTYLPLAALRSPDTGRYLVQDFVVRVMPSGSAIAEMARRIPASSAEGTSGFAPRTAELPHSRAEVETLVGPEPIRRFLDGEATEERLRSSLARDAFVHVATHGILNPRNPLYSRLELAPAEPGSTSDGRLEVHEVMDLDVRSRLVFMSGCETALGPSGGTLFDRGEDYATLSQAFLRAGAESVVATLWRIEDRSASVFADLFFGELQSASVSPTEALALAQRRMIEDPELGAPFHWAAYQLSGWGG